MSALLQVKHLHIEVKKDKRTVVEDVSFTLEEGEALVLLGQSGSGKTMSCHAIMGLLDPKRFQVEGEILFEGKNILMPDKKEKRRLYGGAVAMVPQNPMSAFDPSMRIGKQMEETLALHSAIKGRALHQKVREALQQAGLSDPEMICKSYPHTLSGGMLQRCLIAMTLMTQARVIIADEPTTALDVVHRNDTVKAFLRLQAQGAAILMITHDFAVARQFSGRLMVMKNGIVLEQGNTEEILEHPKTDYTKALWEASRLSERKF